MLKICDTCIEENKEGEEGDHQEKEDDNKPPQLVLEVYDPSNNSYKFVREVFLYKNADFIPFIKQSNSIDFIKQCSFATNGQILVVQRPRKAYYFDAKTGILIQKVVLPEEFRDAKLFYDHKNNSFYSISQESGTKMDIFSISNFRKGGATFGFAK